MYNLLQIIHSTVVDTSVVFPHKMGPPKKRALKTLCREHLNKIIQENGKSRLLAFFCIFVVCEAYRTHFTMVCLQLEKWICVK